MNWPKALLVLLAILFLAVSSGLDLLYRLALLVLALLVVSFLWSEVNVRGLRVRREARSTRSQVGRTLEEQFSLTNRTILPKTWLELRDESTLPGHADKAVITLPAKATVEWTKATICRRRGKYTLGPLTIVSGDPFGLFESQIKIAQTTSVLVHPAVLELPWLAVPVGELASGSALRRRTEAMTPQASHVREYAPGDSLKRIHWLSTARLRELMVKEFEEKPVSDVWVVLDMEGRVQQGEEEDSTEEWGVTVAASLANHFLRQNRAVGLLASGEPRVMLPPDRGTRQLVRILEELAVVRAFGNQPLVETLAIEGRRFLRGDTVLVITPSVEEDWLGNLRLLLQQGVRTVAVLLEPDTFGGPQSAVLVVSSLLAAQVPTFLVKKGEPLAQSLAGDGLDLMARQKAGGA